MIVEGGIWEVELSLQVLAAGNFMKTIIESQIWTIDNFFSPAECDDFIARSEERIYEKAAISTAQGAMLRPEIRNNDRVIWDDNALAQSLWQRVADMVPDPLENRRAVELNERFRFYRYDVGQTFRPHYDGAFTRDNGEVSQVTLMIYLNDNFQGGQTNFDLRYPHGEKSIAPQQGMALLFLHHLRHEGAQVLAGRKYVLRTDVMYGADVLETL